MGHDTNPSLLVFSQIFGGVRKIKPRLRRLLNTSRQFGFDPTIFLSALRGFPKYLADSARFQGLLRSGIDGKIRTTKSPVFADYRKSSGAARGHYFWQDLICARWIFEANPPEHFDVASRIDGFIAHLLSFRKVSILDIRPLGVNVPNLEIQLGDAQSSFEDFVERFPSVSSLHSIEHFGLGRYGDNLDPNGHENGILNISRCVSIGGHLYISFPIGIAAIEFNAQRIIDPLWPIERLPNFKLEEFVLIPWADEPIFGMTPNDVNPKISGQAGLYRFRRIN
jgi:hypothetical protein